MEIEFLYKLLLSLRHVLYFFQSSPPVRSTIPSVYILYIILYWRKLLQTTPAIV